MTEQEKLLQAKIPGQETGIEVKRSFCSICEPLFHCGINAYVKDGKVLKVEGVPGYPMSNGMLCPKGLANREFMYRADRLQHPLRRVGPRGSGQFEQITWEEAYAEIGRCLPQIKEQYGPESVVFFSGYAKWYRSFLQRLAHDFGSPNFGTESSTCHMATVEAWKDMTGRFSVNDTNRSATFLCWAANPYYSKYVQLKGLYAAKERGMKIVVIDPRVTPMSTKLADLHLQIRPGTDAALAFGMAKIIIDNDWIDHDYVENHVYGYEAYKAYVQQFPLERVAKITGLDPDDIYRATEMYATNKPSSISQSGAPIVHHRNGYQTFKAIMSLSAITGNFDTEGGNIPAGETYSHQWANFDTREHEFIHANTPDNVNRRIGYDRFPLWNCFIPEAQMTDFHRHVLTGDPYPIKAIMAFGLNHRMFPEPHKILEALDTMDFVVSSELFMTETCKHADIVLPVCTSLEREEFKVYPGGFATYIKPVVPPVGESRPDSTIISDLVGVLGLDDPLLASGYRKCVDWMLQDLHFNVEDCLAADLPIRVPDFKPYVGREYTNRGYDTPTGKFELSSYTVEQLNCGLSPIPDYEDPYDPEQTGDYPFTLSVGARLPFVLHSRLHDVPWTRSLRPDPMVDMNEDDAAAMGIELNDWVWVENETGRIHVRANPSSKMMPGMLQIYHGYKEADANELVPEAHLDEYSGYPGYNCVRCRIIRDEEVSHS